MIAILARLWSWFSGTAVGKYLIEGLVLIGAIGAAYATIKHEGALAEHAKETESTLRSVETARQVEKEVAAKPADQVDDELANRYSRP